MRRLPPGAKRASLQGTLIPDQVPDPCPPFSEYRGYDPGLAVRTAAASPARRSRLWWGRYRDSPHALARTATPLMRDRRSVSGQYLGLLILSRQVRTKRLLRAVLGRSS